MTRGDAWQAMLRGKKITHKNFTKEEYLHLVNNKIMTEDGFWFGDEFEEREMFKDGWSIYAG